MNFTQDDINALTETRTSKYLPGIKDIPKEFWQGNIYTKMVEAWYIGEKGPAATLVIHDGFNIGDAKQTKKFMMAHLSDIEPMYEHRIAGVAYMLSKVFTITEKKE